MKKTNLKETRDRRKKKRSWPKRLKGTLRTVMDGLRGVKGRE